MENLRLKGKFILASGSPRRKELIRMLGIEPVIEPSALEEAVETADPERLVRALSAQKAADIAARYHAGEIVIGADTCVYVPGTAGEILGKPKTHLEAERMVTLLQGRSHEVYTGVTILRCGEGVPAPYSFVEKTTVSVWPMSEEEIRLYSLLEEPMDKAGAYAVQGTFSRFIKSLDGDYYNVMGLPLGRLYQELKRIPEM
ncbi:MAG: septum formation protein Maf [Lachnospiraceae bacterium]|nr:septum formation protein Maf [Lachnospiraceae bacterium]